MEVLSIICGVKKQISIIQFLIKNGDTSIVKDYGTTQAGDPVTTVIKNSNVIPAQDGVGNISVDPQFLYVDGGDFHLSTSSLCIDSGDNSLNIEINDIDGEERIFPSDGVIDMGFDEFIDSDNDSCPDYLDSSPLIPNDNDNDNDGIFNKIDPDDDNDGFDDLIDVFPYDASEWADDDNDGIGNNSEPDIIIWYVDSSAQEGNDGRTWLTPLANLNEVRFHAGLNDIVWIKSGTYILDKTIVIKSNYSILGGFNGSETATDERDILNNLTAINVNDSIRAFEIYADTEISGFTIKGVSSSLEGSIFYIKNSTSSISECTIPYASGRTFVYLDNADVYFSKMSFF